MDIAWETSVAFDKYAKTIIFLGMQVLKSTPTYPKSKLTFNLWKKVHQK